MKQAKISIPREGTAFYHSVRLTHRCRGIAEHVVEVPFKEKGVASDVTAG
jgi:hypothetical protein